MRTLLAFVAGCALLASAGPVAAAVDCEPARCAVQQAINTDCPCDLSGQSNHGQHVSCVAHAVRDLARADVIPINCKGKIKRCAAKSTCGKPGFVVCNIPTDTCDLTTGTCVANPTLACTTDLDCGSKCKIKSSTERCTERGGTVAIGSTTCCAACGG
jgi:hypothetical protein